MKITRTIQEGQLWSSRTDLRVLAKVKAIEAIVLHLTDASGRLIKTLEITHTNAAFERKECVEPDTFEMNVRLCAQFYFVLTDLLTGKISHETNWYSIEK